MKPIRTLIVEDDPLVADINRRYVESVPGFAVAGTAPSGEKALVAAAQLRPDLITLDVYMPGLSGLEFLAQLRAQDLTVDVIMATAAADGPLVAQAARLGVVDYLVKPYTRERFTAALQRYGAFRKLVGARAALGQEALDRLFPPAAGRLPAAPTPKGIDPVTLERVAAYLTQQEEARPVQEMIAATGLSRVTCLRYLFYLINQGLVGVELAYGGLGRPTKLYRWRHSAAAE